VSQSKEESTSSPGTSPLDVAETTDQAANHAMRWWILAVLGVAQLMVILDSIFPCFNTDMASQPGEDVNPGLMAAACCPAALTGRGTHLLHT
jgi:hypothetical protein